MSDRTIRHGGIAVRWASLIQRGALSLAAWLACGIPMTAAQSPVTHYFQDARMPPGAVGAGQVWRGGASVAHYFQPVHVMGPDGCLISIAEEGRFTESQASDFHAGLLVGQVYRYKISNIPNFEDVEVFPSIEVVDRLYPPPGQQFRFPIPIQITQQDLEYAIAGKLVTRVIYLEDPRTALPAVDVPREQRSYDVPLGDNLLQAADRLGRPMAILRMGSRTPAYDAQTGRFLFESPPVLRYHPPAPRKASSEPSDGLEKGLEGQDYPRLPSPAPPASARRLYPAIPGTPLERYE